MTEGEGSSSRLEGIRIGDHVKVHAKLLDGQRVIATEVERTVPSNSIVLLAPLQLTVDPKIRLALINIDSQRYRTMIL